MTVDGRDTATHPPRELADVVGVVGQDPLAGFVTDTVEEELAYGMEQLAIPPDVDAQACRGDARPPWAWRSCATDALHEISGGQQQRVAIGAVLTAHPRVLVLDEPTSALDPTAAEEVLAAITRLVHDLGVTVVLAEHRLERVVQYADAVIHLPGDGTVTDGPPADDVRRPRRSRRRSWSSAGLRAGRRCRCRSATPAARPRTAARPICRATPPTGATCTRPRARRLLRARNVSCVTATSSRCAASTSTCVPARSPR